MSELRAFALPDVGEGLTEAEILRWHVRPGDVVKVNQMIVEIETAKASVELPCPFAGTVAELHVAEGAIVPVGSPIITVETVDAPTGRGAPGRARGLRRARGRGRAASASPHLGGRRGPATRHRAEAQHRSRRHRQHRRRSRRCPSEGTSVRAKPPVRKLARDLGIDLATVTPTGAQGEVTRGDVMGAGSATAQPARPARPAPQRPRRRRRGSGSRSAASTGRWPTRWCSRRSPRRTSPSGSTST